MRTRIYLFAADGSTVVIYVRRPEHFVFEPGQYASICVPELDMVPTWHAFSIGSGPEQGCLIFFIEVKARAGSWTRRLAERARALQLDSLLLRGPYGSPMVTSSYHSIVAVATGTGVVPMLSLFMLRASRLSFLKAKVHNPSAAFTLGTGVGSGPGEGEGMEVGTGVTLVLSAFQLRYRLRLQRRHGTLSPYSAQLRRVRRADTLHSLARIVILVFVFADVAFAPLALSWANLPARAHAIPLHAALLWHHSIVALAFFALERCFVLSSLYHFPSVHSPLALVDFIVILSNATALVIWDREGAFEPVPSGLRLTVAQQLLLVLFCIYRLVRILMASGRSGGPLDSDGQRSVRLELVGAESFHLVWIHRSADLLIGYLPEIQRALSVTHATHAMTLRIFCTEGVYPTASSVNPWHICPPSASLSSPLAAPLVRGSSSV